MLTTLKTKMRNDVEFKTSLESALENINEASEDIEDIFLDDPDAVVIGAENDPRIKKLVDNLPDDADETEDITAKDIDKIIETFVPMSSLTEAIDDGYENDDYGDHDEDGDHIPDTSETDIGEDQTDIEDVAESFDLDVDLDVDLEAFLFENADEDNDDEEYDIEDEELDESALLYDDCFENFENILGTKQDEIEDADDCEPKTDSSKYPNLLADDQDEIEDADDIAAHLDDSDFENILGTKQDEIEDVKESDNEFDPDVELEDYIDGLDD